MSINWLSQILWLRNEKSNKFFLIRLIQLLIGVQFPISSINFIKKVKVQLVGRLMMIWFCFKMALLQIWYGLSDYEVEDRVNDSISFGRFAGISLVVSAPDHSVLNRLRTEMTQKKMLMKNCLNL
jgi:hypothetical protein